MTEVNSIEIECCYDCEIPLQYCQCGQSKLKKGTGKFVSFIWRSEHKKILEELKIKCRICNKPMWQTKHLKTVWYCKECKEIACLIYDRTPELTLSGMFIL